MNDIKQGGAEDKASQPVAMPLDQLRENLYRPLEPQDGGGYYLWRQFDEDLPLQMSNFFIGGLYQRDVLAKRERQLCVNAAFTVLRCPDELRSHIHAGRNMGATKAEIAGVTFQMLTYGGAPSVVQGLKVAKAAFAERGEWDEADARLP